MENLYLYVGVIGNIISVLVFLSPVGTFRRIVRKGTTEDFECFPYICTLLNSSLWTYYGVTKPGSYLVATVNGFGILVQLLYISLFLIYANSPTTRRKTAIVAGVLNVGFLGGAILVTSLVMEGESKIDAIGFMCAALNILMYASPLAAMKTVVTTKSVEYMPFLLSFFLFLNGGVWTFYAFLVRDCFLAVPNGIGFVFGLAQLLLYSIYRKSKSDLLDGWKHVHVHDPLLPSYAPLVLPIPTSSEPSQELNY